MPDLKKRNALSFFKWLFIIIVFFTLSISLGTVIVNKNIISKLEYLKIPLTSYYETYYLEGEINNVSVDFILDTGASESIISQGELSRVTELGSNNIKHLRGETYTLADGSTIYCERISIKEMKIGGYTINNVTFGVMPNETDNLLGNNVLNKFKKWSINKDELILVKE